MKNKLQEMPRRTLFRITILILAITVPFIMLWIIAGLGWAITVFATVAILVILILRYRRIRKQRDYEYENTDEELYITEKKKRPPGPPVDRDRKW